MSTLNLTQFNAYQANRSPLTANEAIYEGY